MIIKDWLASSTKLLSNCGVSNPRLDCLILLELTLNKNRTIILAHDEDRLTSSDLKNLSNMIKQRSTRLPLAYITKIREFYKLNFAVNKNVLIPRPETELLVETAIKIAPVKSKILEIGTGSGAIAISLAKNRDDLHITATDISPKALKVANQNAKNNNTLVTFVKSDLFSKIKLKYDLILANLPYIPIDARRQPEINYEPDIALYAGIDGLAYYRPFFQEFNSFLNSSGQAIVEFSPTQYATIISEFRTTIQIDPLSEYIYLCTPNAQLGD